MGIILKPFAMLLVAMYNFFNSYGLALILFAVVIKLVLFPVTLKSKKSMIKTTMLSGKMQQLKVQYGKNPERYNMEVQKLYEKEKVNPMGGCLWSLIPMFVLIGLYGIIRNPLVNLMNVPENMIEQVATITGVVNSGNYPQIAMVKALSDPAVLESVKTALAGTGANVFPMNFSFLGLDLASIPTWKFWANGISLTSILMFILPIVSAAVSYLSMKVTTETNKINKQAADNQADSMTKSMILTMPLMSLWIGFTVPAGLSVYWVTQYLISMVQEVICSKMLKKDYEAAQAAAEEQARLEKEEEKRLKEEARLERARRIEEEKNNKGKKKKSEPKDIEPDQIGVNKNDSREGLRAYARGRAYIPGRFGEVTSYSDPTALVLEEIEKDNRKWWSKKKKSETEEEKQETAPVKEEPTPVEEPVVIEAAPLPETQEIEVEVEEIEVEVAADENEEGV